MFRRTTIVALATSLASMAFIASTATAATTSAISKTSMLKMFAAASPAGVTSCSAIGLIPNESVEYGICQTDLNGGKSSDVFSRNGQTVHLSASTQQAPQQTVSFWSSNGPVAATQEITIDVRSASLTLKGAGTMKLVLIVSYNGAVQEVVSDGVDTNDSRAPSVSIPPGATNVWWQLEAIATAPQKGAQATASLSLIGVDAY